MRIRLAIPDQHVSADVLDAALEATTRAAQSQMRTGEAPTFSQLLQSGVKWRPERFNDGEHFDLPTIVGERGWGDCDDLAPALAAELRLIGDPGARARVVPTGPDRWHAIVQLSDGTLLDPSQMAGMRRVRQGVRGAIARPMADVGESAIAIMPENGEWWSRTDAPWDDGHIASISHHRDLLRSLDRSIGGAVACGACAGWPTPEHLAVLGDLFGSALEAGAGLIPGGSTAYDVAKRMFGGGSAAAPGPGGGLAQGAMSIPLPHGGKAICSPGGPIIVRF